MKEIWKDIKGYEGLYQVSNLGRVKSLERVDAMNKKVDAKIMSQTDNGNGYLYISLHKNGKRKVMGVHRLVALTFIPNPNNKPQVNHIDEDKTNNRIDNLNWMTGKENSNYGNHNKNSSLAHERTCIIAYHIKTGTFIYFNSLREAEREIGVYHSNISRVLKGVYKQSNGYTFTISEEKSK